MAAVGESGPYCAADACGSTVPDNAQSNALSQSQAAEWSFSETPGQCTFSCADGFSWDGASCRASCQLPVSVAEDGLQYGLSGLSGALAHGASTSLNGTHAFGTPPLNGTLSAVFTFACADGSLSVSAVHLQGGCQTNHTWNSDRAEPECSPDSRQTACGGSVPENATASTPAQYLQTWDGLSGAWLPELSWSESAQSCGYACDGGYVASGGACVPYAAPECGTANGVATVSAPASNLCAVGTASSVSSAAAAYSWTCANAPAPDVSCSAPRQYVATFDANGGGTPSFGTKNVSYNAAV